MKRLGLLAVAFALVAAGFAGTVTAVQPGTVLKVMTDDCDGDDPWTADGVTADWLAKENVDSEIRNGDERCVLDPPDGGEARARLDVELPCRVEVNGLDVPVQSYRFTYKHHDEPGEYPLGGHQYLPEQRFADLGCELKHPGGLIVNNCLTVPNRGPMRSAVHGNPQCHDPIHPGELAFYWQTFDYGATGIVPSPTIESEEVWLDDILIHAVVPGVSTD